MNFTSRMAALLGELRRERNGAVADAMCFYGKPYGLNYGVSLSTVRQIARAEAPDHDFASYLYLQDVRELRLIGLHIAVADRIGEVDFPTWAAGIINSEVAEEAAFALLSRIESLNELFETWTNSDKHLLQYAALMAASRSGRISPAWIETALDLVRCHVVPGGSVAFSVPSSPTSTDTFAARLTVQGAVALLAAFGAENEENRQTVLRAVGSPGSLPAMNYVHEELIWRLSK